VSIAETTIHAEQMRELRQDNVALRAALDRCTAERDNWRLRAHNLEFRHAQFVQAVRNLCKEPVQ
jgi:hypothetical protein